MAGPSLDWLQQVQAGLANGAPVPPPAQPFALGAMPIGGPAPAPALTADMMPPAPGMIPMPPPQGPPAPPAPPAGMSVPHEDPSRMMSVAPPTSSQGPTAPPTGVEPGPPPPAPPPPMPNDVQFAPVGGGVLPAREAPVRGPVQSGLIEASYGHPQEAIDRIKLRTGIETAHQSDVYEQQAEQAFEQQKAIAQVAQRRQDEARQLQADYQGTVKQLGQMHFDENRWFSKKTTGGKIESILLGVLSGIIDAGAAYGHGSGHNLAKEALMREIDGDAEAQRFDYMVAQDKARGAQNAYAMAMERYGSEDAAMAATRAAALDYTMAKGRQLAAQWGGMEQANKMDMLEGQLGMELDQTMAAGLQYVPARAGPGGYRMMVRGQEIPGIVPTAKAQQIALEHGVKPAERVDEEMVKGGIQATIEDRKQSGKQAEKADEGAKFIASQLQSAGVPMARSLADRALASLNRSEGGAGEAAARAVLGEKASNAVMSDNANAREQDYWAFKNAAMKAIAGNVTSSEEARMERQFGSAYDPASRRRAISSALEMLGSIEQSIKAGVSPDAQKTFDRSRSAASAPSTMPKSFTAHGKK